MKETLVMRRALQGSKRILGVPHENMEWGKNESGRLDSCRTEGQSAAAGQRDSRRQQDLV